MQDKSRIRLTAAVVVAIAVTGVALAAWLWPHPERQDQPVVNGNDKGTQNENGIAIETDPETYRAMVSAFYAGVAALDADANDRAKQELARATQLVPDEPAAWLNLGLVGIRSGEDEAAIEALKQAQSLAPEAAAADRLLGLLESRRGNMSEAIGHLRRAIDKDPDDLRALYALAEEIERQSADDAAAEAGRLLAQIIERKPNNIAVLIQRGRLALKMGDVATVKEISAQLRPLATGWPNRAQEQLRQVEESLEAGDLRSAVPRLTVLRNLLLAEPDFRADLAEVALPIGVVGDPVERFLKLPQPAPTPSPPDTNLSFAIEPIETGETRVAALTAIPAVSDEGEPAVFVADGSQVRQSGDSNTMLAFPGGPQAMPPGPDGLLLVDWNSDDAIDLVCAGAGGLRVYRRESDGTFVDATESTGLDADVIRAAAAGVWAVDIELDGDLDLVVGSQSGPPVALQNNGDGTFSALNRFEDVTEARQLAWCDLDRNGVPDVAFLDAAGALHVFANERSGRYGRRTVSDAIGTVRALTAGDPNADSVIDLILLKSDGAVIRLSKDDGDDSDWHTVLIANWDQVPPNDVRLFLADLDNNGALDLVGSSQTGPRIWLGDGSDRLAELRQPVAMQLGSILDIDGDGKLDLVGLSDRGVPIRGVNEGTKPYHWQALRPRAARIRGDGRINSFGLAGEIDVRSGLLVQKQVISGPTVHFGLGEHPKADVARIVWPNGTVQAEFDAEVDQVLKAEQRLKGSCPFVYAFDGKNVRFVTDFLWRSPLGLRINAQDTAGIAQTEDWIKIRGDQLAARDGYYDVRITAELWETHYFDHVSLMVVDHPAGSEVFVDERFVHSPPALEVHLTGRLHPVRARDDLGHDVTEVVAATDGRYLDTFGRGQYQGVTRDHWVEIEIADDVPRHDGLRLIARGWVHPTDSSINVALSQGRHDPPQGLVLELPADGGDWTVARDDLGFPAGKDKTIVVNLDDLFPADGPRRFRLRTNLEVFWDQLSVATAIAPDETTLQTQRIAPASADLRHRGYSLMTQADAGSPELPHYDTLSGTAQRWRDLEGYYTRYGDVRELLSAIDDRYVIANAGDEVVFRFPAAAPPADGWVRDFVLIGDGWNKDGDFNTAFSATVLPLPSHGSTSYDVPPGELEDDPVYRRHAGDWTVYHTRYVVPDTFELGPRPHSPLP